MLDTAAVPNSTITGSYSTVILPLLALMLLYYAIDNVLLGKLHEKTVLPGSENKQT